MNERERVYGLLRRIDQEGAYAWIVLDGDVARHGESKFVRAAVLGVLRWRSRLDYIIEQIAGRGVERLQQPVLALLRGAIHELLFMSSPAYAVVSETVALAARHAPRARGLVNAVLRKASSADLAAMIPAGDSMEAIATRLAHPVWMMRRWAGLFGVGRAIAIAEADQQLSYPDLLLNRKRPAAPDQLANIQHEQSELVDGMVRLRGSTMALAEQIASGDVYPMDEGSALIASIARSAGDDLLDLAAAPGGKSLYLGMQDARVVSHDVSIGRLQPLRRQWRQWIDTPQRIVVGDGRHPPFRRRFETVLLDAPCSATGTIRKNPEIKWRLREEDLPEFTQLQRELATAALEVAAERVVYATCSLEPEENAEVIEAVLAANSGFVIGDVAEYVPARAAKWVTRGVLRLTPESGADGFTAFVLRRR